MTKTTIVTLINCSSDERDEYRLISVTTDVLNKSKADGGSEAMKKLLRERLNGLFGNIEEYFGEDYVTGEANVTREDVDDCIDRLAKGEAASIMCEDFWWCDEEELIMEL